MTIEFPVYIDKCPMCGSHDRIIGAITQEEVLKDKIGSDKTLGTEISLIAVFDPTKPSLQCPHVIIVRDDCAACGFRYTVFSAVQMLPVPQMQKVGQGQMR